MNSTEENKYKQGLEANDTATSDFYTVKSFTAAQKMEMSEEPASIEQLEGQATRLRESLFACNQLVSRLDSNEEMKKYTEETYEELAVVKAQTINQQGTLKMAFQHNYSALEREMAAYKRSWKQTKENAEAEMEEQLDDFKADIKKDQLAMNKAMALTTSTLKTKTGGLLQEVKEAKKARVQSTSGLMAMLEQSRAKLDNFTQNERKKRNEYDGVVLGLLDRTVDQGERILRRIG